MRIIYIFAEPIPLLKARYFQAVNTAHYLAEAGAEVVLVVAGLHKPWPEILSDFGLAARPNLQVVCLRRRLGCLTSSRLFHFKLGSWLRRQEEAFLYVRHLKTANFLAKKGYSGLLVYEAHEIYADKHPHKKELRKQEVCVFGSARATVFISYGLREAVRQRYQLPGPAAVVPSACFWDPAAGGEPAISRPEEIYYVGTDSYPWKGVSVLLDAMLRLEGLRLVILGEAARLRRHPAARALLEQGRLVLKGPMAPKRVRKELRKAMVAVIPNTADSPVSSSYTSPLKILDYMAARTAIVASDLPSIREIVSEREAHFVPPGDPRALALGIEKVVNNADLRESLAAAAYLKAYDYSWEKRAARIMDLLMGLSQQENLTGG